MRPGAASGDRSEACSPGAPGAESEAELGAWAAKHFAGYFAGASAALPVAGHAALLEAVLAVLFARRKAGYSGAELVALLGERSGVVAAAAVEFVWCSQEPLGQKRSGAL